MMSFISFAKSRLINLGKVETQSGFTLVEMGIVLAILGFLLAGLIIPLSSQREISQRQEAERQLQEIRSALLGFVQANGMFPCPATLNGNGREDRVGANCNTANGFVPFQVLGLEGTLFNGNIVDPWQQPYRYRVTNPDPMGANWIYTRQLTPLPTQLPDFRVCSVRTCVLNQNQIIAVQVAAVIFSTGRDGADLPVSISPDQLENTDNDTDFVMRPYTGDTRTGQEFDDILVWISRSTLVYELSRAGQ